MEAPPNGGVDEKQEVELSPLRLGKEYTIRGREPEPAVSPQDVEGIQRVFFAVYGENDDRIWRRLRSDVAV